MNLQNVVYNDQNDNPNLCLDSNSFLKNIVSAQNFRFSTLKAALEETKDRTVNYIIIS